MINEFKEQLFDELSMSSMNNEITKDKVAAFFNHVEENAAYFKNKGTFLSMYLKFLEHSNLEKYLTDLADAGETGVIAVQLLNNTFFDLTDVGDLDTVISKYILINDEADTADYFNGMKTNDPLKKFNIYEQHFGKDHDKIKRIGSLVFDLDEYSQLSCFDKKFWNENQHDYEKFSLNGKLTVNLNKKSQKIRTRKI
ncbi:hypothetical protein [Serratia marcescens]|uniref:hypothetical protein n=1 Tax=Serratia marcescens TaxID=615 RepID=UPI001F150BAD|nr:hypothetical protein [Serratia marcescens]